MAPKRSVVWEHFKKINEKCVKCEICKKDFNYHNNTTNLKGNNNNSININ